MSNPLTILGVDPGFANTGWGVIETGKSGDCRLVEYGCISTSPRAESPSRLAIIYTELIEIAERFAPGEAAVEKLFFARNTKSAMDVAQARGAVILALNHAGARIFEYTPLEIKQALVGYGRASKQQVQYMAGQFLNVKEVPGPEHASDALAAALCHAGSRKLRKITGRKT